jgi:DNA-binding Xre family transcriptional regulator
MEVHSNLKQLLDDRNISIRQAAREIDYRFATVRQMYNDETKHYPKDLLSKLCNYLDVRIDELLTRK